MILDMIRQQLKRLEEMDKDIAEIEKRLTLWKKDQEAVTRLMAIPGVGLLTATAIIATVGNMKSFRSGREFAAFLGLVRQSGPVARSGCWASASGGTSICDLC